MSGMSAGRFLLADGFGSLLYGGAFLCLGYCFNRQIQQRGAALATVGGGAFGLLVGCVVIYIGFKYWQRQRVLRELRVARITVDELRRKLETGEDLFILDLRSRAELKQDPSLIRGAVHLGGADVASRHHEIPRDRDVIVYCSCPNEVTSARLALRLRRKGISRVWPLLGGIAAWREQNYPTELRTLVETRHVTGDLARSEPKLSEEPTYRPL